VIVMGDAARPLEGKVALVTGAGRGLGRAFAERLAALGCSIGVHGMREEGPAEYGEGTTLTDTAAQIGRDAKVRTIRVLGDLTLADHVQRVTDTVAQQLGPIDILVHNAGGDIAAAGGKPDPNDAVRIKEIDVRAVLDRNLLSTILVCQQAALQMMPRKSGRIVNISSIAAFVGCPNSAIYATSKAGVVAYTRSLAGQLRPYNVTVNSIAPGDTRTGRYLVTRHVDPERLVTEGTLERVGLVDEVARVVEFFAGPLGDFVTGQVLRVDGGSQLWSA
jgi:3-oxoacyl-[acyl-carrier protein] reductase